MKYACLISLGCAKNLVDSETMVKRLVDMGYQMTQEAREADVIVVNTCGFLESAVQEAIEVVLEAARYKVEGKCSTLVVAGCMVQRYGKKLLKELPEVDIFLGTSHYQALETAVESQRGARPGRLWIGRPGQILDRAPGRVISTGAHSAYVKIAEGCDNSCSFCIIPKLRGPLRSRLEADILAEARRLSAEGIKEINLIAQDTTAFGMDRNEPEALADLLEKLEEIPGTLAWIRLLYCYPDRIGDRLLNVMAHSAKIVPYLDIPLQHCAAGVLTAMGRPAHSAEGIIEKIRSILPAISLRTSLMVGFPGETRAQFKSLLEFMQRVRFDHAGVFVFSPEAGTRAARLGGRPGKRTSASRRAALLELQREISREKLEELVGRTLPVLIEGPHPESDLLLCGRLPTQAPEVDGCVIITDGAGEAGEMKPVRITASHDYDLEGIVAGPGCA
ncbi:MAG: 30S ribosomal protein S12 methylthiotransferase RimO [Syntrophobacteraceae bacterium]|nr:30S ribosomal protein S12 methylthiotransferase RimO [Syntrophobacteraceae bacterium]